MATIIRTDGQQEEITGKPTLEQLQKAVGGLIEAVHIVGSKKVMIVNEEGLLKNLPLNPIASQMVRKPIVGDVVICKRVELD